MAQKKGNFIVKNAAGTVILAGRAQTYVNDTTSAGVTDTTPLEEHTNAAGVPSSLTKNYTSYEMRLTLIPGVGSAMASAAVTKTACEIVPVGSTIVTSGFDVASLNWPAEQYGTVRSSSVSATADGNFSIDVTCRKIYDDTNSAWKDFTGAWTNL